MSESDDWGKVWERLLATSDVVVATRYVEDHYEIHAGGPQPKRISWARGFLAKYGSLTPGGPVEGDVSCDETTAVGPDGWIWPVKGDIRPGPCWNAVVGGRYHAGMDINSTKANNPAIAAANGVVVMTGRGSASGNYVIIKSNEGDIYYSYQHLESIAVTQDKPIAAGAVVGIIGKTGNVRLGPGNQGHLHFVTAKIQTLGEYSQSSQVGGSTTDPLNYLPKDAPDGYRCTK
jgi:murein DD-endopeptidase MepM/ murein hydrolase activator NlpD